jgi:NhaA family Na+:H+ antiporter
MVVFFFVVGLEIKREFVGGELSGWRRSSPPVICAIGGMLMPAAAYSMFIVGTAAARGWAIPMATDIAFALGVLKSDRLPRVSLYSCASPGAGYRR